MQRRRRRRRAASSGPQDGLSNRQWLDRRRNAQRRRRRRPTHRHAVARHRAGPGERRTRHRGDRARHAQICVDCGWPARTLGDVDGIRAVVANPAVVRAAAPPRQIRLAPGERHPAIDGRAVARRQRPAAAAVPGDQRRRPFRSHDVLPGAPTPAAAFVHPATVMRRRVAPRRVVDPGVAEAAHPGPVAETVRRPIGESDRRIPDRTIRGGGLPRAVTVEIRVADHLRGDVARRASALVVAIAARAPRIERIDAAAVCDFGVRGSHAGHRDALSRQRLLFAARERDRCLAFAHDERRRLGVGIDVDSIESCAQQPQLRVRRVDVGDVVAGIERAHANDETALRNEQRELAIVEPRHVHAGAAGDSELTAAVVDLGATVRRHPEIVAARDGLIEADRRPIVCLVFRRREQFAGEIGDTRDPARKVVVLTVRARREQDDERERGDQRRTRHARRSMHEIGDH